LITFIAHIRVPAANAAAFEAIMTYVAGKSREHEPGVAYYAFARSADEPDTYAVVEVYRDAAAHAAHMQTDWVKESIPRTLLLTEGLPDIKQYVTPGTEPVRRRWNPKGSGNTDV
jgi:quinol monooxygenase YgiN